MTATLDKNLGQWHLAARSWSLHGAPLRPSEQDVEFYRQALIDWCNDNPSRPPRAMIFGVTPEIYRLPWPKGSSVIAVDRTPEMIENVWPGPRADALLSDWRAVPLPARSVDLAYCDGGFHLLDFPDGQTKLCAEIERLLDQDGRFITRLFTPPAVRQTPEQVLDDLMAGRISSLDYLKPRLWMALQETAEAGVSVGQVWEWLHALASNWSELAAKLGWSVEHLSAIDSYRDSSARYYCVTLEQVQAMFCDAHEFDRHQLYVPDYHMGDWFPTLVLRRT